MLRSGFENQLGHRVQANFRRFPFFARESELCKAQETVAPNL